MFSAIYYLLPLYLLASACVLLSPQLIDFGFCLVLSTVLALLSVSFYCRKDKKYELRFYRFPFAKSLGLTAWFFGAMTWIAGFSLWQIDQRLDESFEGKNLVVKGRVYGLPAQEERRQVFEFLAEEYWQCSELNEGECQKVSKKDKPLASRLFSLELSDLLWFYFFRENERSAMPRKIRVALYQFSDQNVRAVKAGESYRLLLRLRRPRSSLNFVGFDYETWLFTQGIHANAYVRNHVNNQVLESEVDIKARLSGFRETLRQSLITYSNKNIKGDEKNQAYSVTQALALVLALTIGDRSFISTESKKLLVSTGTAHLLAISGMHIGLLSALTFFIGFNLGRILLWLFAMMIRVQFQFQSRVFIRVGTFISWGLSPIKIAAIFSLLSASAYALIAGFSLPTQRALIMVACYSLGFVFYRKINFYVLWCSTMLLVLMHDPFAVLSSGFYLSFIAVFLIQWVFLGYFYPYNSKIRSGVLNAVKAQWAVFIGLMPLLAVFFLGFFPLALLCNVFSVPFVSFIILPLGLLATFFIALNIDISFIAIFIENILKWTEYFIDLLILLLRFSKSLFPYDFKITFDIFSALSLFIVFILTLGPWHKRLKILSLIFLLPLVVSFYSKTDKSNQIPEQQVRVQVFDVGQGLAVLVETKNHRLIYDTGPAYGESFDAGSAVVLPALMVGDNVFSKRRIDNLILSHGDQDHIGGAQSIIDAYKIDKILGYQRDFYESTDQHFAKVSTWQNCEAGQSWRWDGVKFQILYPSNRVASKEGLSAKPHKKITQSNNLSCVLLIEALGFSMLLPGDIEKSAERELVEHYGSVLQADILVAAHHGSKSSSSNDFLASVSPKLVVVSAGFKNQFGHPHKDVMKRYGALKAQVLNTAEMGALKLESWRFSGDSPLKNIQKAREQEHRFWRF